MSPRIFWVEKNWFVIACWCAQKKCTSPLCPKNPMRASYMTACLTWVI